MDKESLILIVDDESYFREIFSKLLEAKGFRVETAENGKEGVEMAKKIKPDLVLMDVKMPVMDGVEAVMKMKEDSETKNMKVIFLTAFGNPEEEMQNLNNNYAKELGAAGYIKKTDDLDLLSAKIKAYV